MSGAEDFHRFERVDWDDLDESSRIVSARRLVLAIGVLAVFAAALYDEFVAHVTLVAGWTVDPIDWAFLLAVVLLVAYGVVPVIRRPAATRRVFRRLRTRPVTLLASAYVLVFVLVGVFGPVVFSNPGLQFQYAYHPPVGLTSRVVPTECLGGITGEAFGRRCHGTLRFPLGTNYRGIPMRYLLVSGARTAVYVTVIAAAFVVPIAIGVGVLAGVRGGLLDDLLMAYVDLQLCIPAIVFYFIGYMYWRPSLLLLIVAFGLLGWGGIARLVRSEVLQRREDGHVRIARSLGASETYIAKRHVIPNITNTLAPAVFHLLAILVLAEAGIAFLGFHEIGVYSWGATISEAMNARVATELQTRANYPAHHIWWVSLFPALAVALTILSFKVLGDGIRDALDPRHNH